MKKFLKVLAAAAAIAAVVPYKGEGDENGGELQGLFWKATWKVDPDYQSDPDINITFGFNNPFEALNKEAHLFADELVVDYCCDSSMTPPPARDAAADECCDENFADMDGECTCSEECTCGGECGDDCGCKE